MALQSQAADHIGQEIGGSELQLIATERQDSSPQPSDSPGLIRITYWILEKDALMASHCINVDPSDPFEVKRLTIKYIRKRTRLFNDDLNILNPANCFAAAAANARKTILLILDGEIDISEELGASVSTLTSQGGFIVKARSDEAKS